MIPHRRIWGAANIAPEFDGASTFHDSNGPGSAGGDDTSISRSAKGGYHRTTSESDSAPLIGGVQVDIPPSSPAADGGKKEFKRSVSMGALDKYGTFHAAQRRAEATNVKNKMGPRLLSDRDVVVKYFNSRGRSGDTYAQVELHPDELRSPIIQHQGGSKSVFSMKPSKRPQHHALPQGRTQSVDEITSEEQRLWDQITDQSSSIGSSRLELNMNWYFVDVVGRDEHIHRKEYNKRLKQLSREFDICPTFLVEREHTLVLPQILESPDYPRQYHICLRVATEKISTTDDSIVELTNRWLMVVDLNKKVCIVLHRLDCESMSRLRLNWQAIMSSNDIGFEEFLLKLMDDAVNTFSVSLNAHASLLDICESKLLQTSKAGAAAAQAAKEAARDPSSPHSELNRITYGRVLSHFDSASKYKNVFLTQLLDTRSVSIDKSEMNSFLYHLHRRSSVQHRVLMLTKSVLSRSFTKLRLCSKQHSNQMCSLCIELSDKAQETRDDSQHLLDMHISLQSFRTNELMAVLTRLSVLFTPCAFLAGVYGMNFHWMPELAVTYGYVGFWAMCFAIAGSIQFYFYRRGLF
jgi:Mg2+ and Co2+ transporter CorA